jgi:pimeloyl-ACP methyl ester carboxylesterase
MLESFLEFGAREVTMSDVIERGRGTDQHPVPLLFVHGAWHGAWCWDEHFLDLFADKGYRAAAVNLRAHGGRPSTKRLHRHSTDDYLADVADAAGRLPTPPVVIGHSMGGYLVQKYLQSHQAPAAVLAASAPATGVLPFLVRWTRQRPTRMARSLVTGNSRSALLSTPELVRKKMFSPHTPESDVIRYAARLQNESRRAIPDLLFRLPKPDRVRTPLLVLGFEYDDCFTQEEVVATARAYRTEAKIFPGLGHDFMLEPGWRAVAEHIDAWLVGRGL